MRLIQSCHGTIQSDCRIYKFCSLIGSHDCNWKLLVGYAGLNLPKLIRLPVSQACVIFVAARALWQQRLEMEQSPLSAAKLSVRLPVSVASATEYTSKPECDDDPNRLVAGSALSVTTSILGGRKRHRQCSAESHHVDESVSESVPPISKVCPE